MATGALVTWTKEEFSVGIGSIDEQHQALFGIVNTLFMAMVNREDHTVAARILGELASYARVHFTLEEQMMEEAGYQNLNKHRLEHRAFVDKVHALARRLLAKRQPITLDLLHFLRDWLVKHIQVSDRAYAKTVLEHQNPKPWWKIW